MSNKERTPKAPEQYAAKVKSLVRPFEIPHDVIAALPVPEEIKKRLDELYRITERSHSAWLLVSKSEAELLENLQKIEAGQAERLLDRYFDAVSDLIKVDCFLDLVREATESTKDALDTVSQGNDALKEEIDKQYELVGFAAKKYFETWTDFLKVVRPE